jgi:hypothetical protein
MLDVEFYNLLMEAFDALYSAGSACLATRQDSASAQSEQQPVLLQLRAGRAESPGWFLTQAAEFDPEPLTVENLRVRDVYASERLVQALLELMASEEWLDRSAHRAYNLTPKGRAVVQRRIQCQRDLTAGLAPLAAADLAQLARLLGQLIDASLAAPAPPGSWCLAHSRRRAPAHDAPELVRIAHYFSDFNAFRDDAHMAAWQPHQLDGYVWEAFATLCDGEADSAAALFEQLAYRGYSVGEYATALEVLARRGWLEPATTTGAYRITADGRTAREVVERLTDSYFYAPWSCLTEAQIAELRALLLRFIERLRALTEARVDHD